MSTEKVKIDLSEKKYAVTDEKLARVKEIQLFITEYVISLCEKHDIPIFLGWGTILGAIRHQGFIPWDDDIDLAILREDYNKFIEVFQAEGHEAFEMICPELLEDCPYLFGKVALKDTGFYTWDSVDLKIPSPISIDLFPIDGVPIDEKVCGKHARQIRTTRFIYIASKMRKAGNQHNKLIRACFTIIRSSMHAVLRFMPKRRIFEKYLSIVTKYPAKTGKAITTYEDFRWSRPTRLRKPYFLVNYIFPLQKHVFEDREFPIPSNYIQMLTSWYGDYMRLPAENERVGHKPLGIDLGQWETDFPCEVR